MASRLFVLSLPLLVFSIRHHQTDGARFPDEGESAAAGPKPDAAECTAWGEDTRWISKRATYRMSMVLSGPLLDRVAKLELPFLVHAMGFAADFKSSAQTVVRVHQYFPAKEPTYVASVSHLTFLLLGHRVLNDVTYHVKFRLTPDHFEMEDVWLLSSEGEPPMPKRSEPDSSWLSWRGWVGWASKKIKDLALDASRATTSYMQSSLVKLISPSWKSMRRTICFRNSKVHMNVYVQDLVLAEDGSVGLGLVFHEAACHYNTSYKDLPPLLLDEKSKFKLFRRTQADLSRAFPSHWPPVQQDRFSIAVEDGFIGKLSGSMTTGVAFRTFMHIVGGRMTGKLAAMIADTDGARRLMGKLVTAILHWLEIAPNADLKDLLGVCRRAAKKVKTSYLKRALYDASTTTLCITDLTNQNEPMLSSLFTEAEVFQAAQWMKGYLLDTALGIERVDEHHFDSAAAESWLPYFVNMAQKTFAFGQCGA
eukprot:TRINITY_DN36259_c0_g1_i1.p1 TRINITY_DN36259_c0_g1~~TRINITY_DN36259_c0_g1_i1.p1  ORF type:complete len:479 (-),score=78.32 TRINITY_DN36259_c0_g1_i1:154-1590(-)